MNNILCTNLVYFTYFVQVLEQTKNIYEVDFPIKSDTRKSAPVRIDIVADNGATWMKVIARSSKGLADMAFGRSNYGSKTILDQAKSYSIAAADSCNFYCFKKPKVN